MQLPSAQTANPNWGPLSASPLLSWPQLALALLALALFIVLLGRRATRSQGAPPDGARLLRPSAPYEAGFSAARPFPLLAYCALPLVPLLAALLASKGLVPWAPLARLLLIQLGLFLAAGWYWRRCARRSLQSFPAQQGRVSRFESLALCLWAVAAGVLLAEAAPHWLATQARLWPALARWDGARGSADLQLGAQALWQQVALVSLLPALCEEYCFRGGLLRFLRARGVALALVLQAVVFAAAHGSFQRALWMGALGLLAGLAMGASGRLGPAVLLHGTYNLLLLLVARRDLAFESAPGFGWRWIALGAWVSLGLWLGRQHIGKQVVVSAPEPGQL